MGDYINYVSINKNKILLSIKGGKARFFLSLLKQQTSKCYQCPKKKKNHFELVD